MEAGKDGVRVRDGPSECGTMRWAVVVIVTMMMVKTVMIMWMGGDDNHVDGW